MEKVSIIVPVYNVQKYLNRCIESLVCQTYNNIEILLIDDGSTDGSGKICDKWAIKDDRIRVFHKENGGVSSTRNYGLKHATGDIIGFCDADDEFVQGALQQILDKFQENLSVSIVVGGYYRVSKNTKTYMGFRKSTKCSFNKIINHSIYDLRIMGSVWNKFFKRELLKNIWFNEILSYCEDTHFLVSVLAKNQGKSACVINKPLYKYIYNAQSVTRDFNNLFDEKGQLKYVNALLEMLKIPSLRIYTKLLIRRQMLWLSIEWYTQASQVKERNALRRNIKSCFWCYFLTFYIKPTQMPRTIISTLKQKIKHNILTR